jgi:hypothetical protein
MDLAARQQARRTARRNPYAAAALRKMVLSLERLAPHNSRHLGQAREERIHEPIGKFRNHFRLGAGRANEYCSHVEYCTTLLG